MRDEIHTCLRTVDGSDIRITSLQNPSGAGNSSRRRVVLVSSILTSFT
jgi:hypothetical protein